MSASEEGDFSTADVGSVEPDLLDTTEEQYEKVGEEEFGAPQSSTGEQIDEASVRLIGEWKEKRQAEIDARDAAEEEGKNQLQEEAVKHIDDFYENYNRKKEQQLESVKQEAEAFLQKNENFSSQQETTTWDRVLQLINEDDADVLGDRDRSKFKEILQRLKGNANAPGA